VRQKLLKRGEAIRFRNCENFESKIDLNVTAGEGKKTNKSIFKRTKEKGRHFRREVPPNDKDIGQQKGDGRVRGTRRTIHARVLTRES